MSFRIVSTIAIACTISAAVATAGPLPPSWSYRVSVEGDPYRNESGGPEGGSGRPFVPAYTPPSGQSSAVFTTGTGQWLSVTGDRALALTTLQIRGMTSRDTFSTYFGDFGTTLPGGYTVTLDLRDDATGEVGQLAFRGALGGGFRFGENGQPVSNVFNLFEPAKRTLNLGGRTYAVDVGSFGAPGTPDIRDGVERLTDAGMPSELRGSVAVSATPEPGTLVLAAIGAGVAFGVRSLRRRLTGFAAAL